MATTTEADRLRAAIRETVAARGRGDLDERRFDRRMAELTVDLYRAAAAERLAPDETIRLQHHVIQNHLRLNRSVLRDADQEAVSLFLTDRRLLLLRCVHAPTQALTADHRDGTAFEEAALAEVRETRRRAGRRWGEAAAGAVIVAVALLFGRYLAVTGPLLLALGAAGVAHALLFPTRWLEVVGATGEPPIIIPAVGTRSGRALARALAEVPGGSSPSRAMPAGTPETP